MKIQPSLLNRQPAVLPAQSEGMSAAKSAPASQNQLPEFTAFTNKEAVLTQKAAEAVQSFMKTAPGTEAEKQASVKALTDKGIMPDAAKLTAVHAALTGTPFGRAAADWLSESDISFPASARAAIDKALMLGRVQEAAAAVQSESALPEDVQAQIQALIKQHGSSPALGTALQSLADKLGLPASQLQEQAAAVQATVLNSAAVQKLTEAISAMLKEQPDSAQAAELARRLEQGAPVQDVVAALRALGDHPALKQADAAEQLALVAQKLLENARQPSSVVLPESAAQSPVQKAIALIQKEPSFAEVLSFIKKTLPEMDKAVGQAEALFAAGKEMAARAELLKAIAPLAPADQTKAAAVPDELFAHVPLASKQVVMTVITEKLSQAAIDFKAFQREIVRNLQLAEMQPKQTKPVLENTIKTLDHAILKSSFTLYTDMKTEKQLMQASQQLAEARKLLSKGEAPAAGKLIAEVKNTIDQLTFKPSDTRVMHVAAQEAARTPQQHLAGAMTGLHEAPTARNAFELVRAAGLTHEQEQAAALLKGKTETIGAVKQALLQSMNQPAGEAAASLTGQQLLSKPEAGLQSMVMSLPFLLGGQAENVNVFIRSKNGGQQVDWQNCSIQVLFETKKLGPVGLTISAAERDLSVRIQNDRPDFEPKMAPLAAVLKNRLSDIGYQVRSVQFGVFTKPETSASTQSEKPAAAAAKGFDWTI